MKNGRTAAGTQRWICQSCGSSSVRRRPDLARRNELTGFLSWLTGKASQRELDGGTGRSFRAQHAWCWNITPSIPVTGEIYPEVQLDGLYLDGGWCVLIAINHTGHVIARQWAMSENQAAWETMLARLPPPEALVCDGGAGLLAALRTTWPGVRLQRCLVHVQRNVRRQLTTKPRTEAGKSLRRLSLALTKITTQTEATTWLKALNAWHSQYGHLVKQRTYRTQAPFIPGWVRPGQHWWFTHDRLRRAYRLLERLAREETLFTYLEPTLEGHAINATTNQIEGGVNAQLRHLLRTHRGMTSTHQRRAIDWWCYLHSENPPAPADLIRPEHYTPKPARPATTIETNPGPASYDTGLTAEEGLWTRSGWAGRSHHT